MPDPSARVLVVLGYPTMADAADATPGILPHRPTACEGLDSRIVQRVRDVPAAVVPDLPRGDGWLVVELAGDDPAELAARAVRVVADGGALDSLVVTEPAEAAAIWRIREDGAGLAARTSEGRPAHAGWEDAAVPVAQLGSYLRDFEALLAAHRLDGVPYGHFGDGCVHVRIDFPFGRDHGVDGGRAGYRAFVEDAARLVAGYGGSMSGEHGDGRARSELLPHMYSAEVLALFGRVKALFDPEDLLNPGVLVRPAALDADVRVAEVAPHRQGLALAYRHDGGDLTAAVHRCTGVGKCRADLSATGAVMCPSFQATREEKDSTRGRARVLQEMLAPDGPVRDWRSPEVHAALDLCLSCKGCARDCPTGVDMASYKSEVLHQSYRRRLRPRSHYTLGRLPRWADLAARAPGVVNAVMRSRRRTAARPVVGRGRPAPRPADVRATDVPAAVGGPARAGRDRWRAGRAVGRLVHRPLRPGGGRRRRAGARGGRLPGAGRRRRHLLRPDLGHHRAARHRADASCSTRSGPWPGSSTRASPSSAWSRPARRCCAATRPSCSTTPPRPGSRPATRTLAELLAGTPGWAPPSLDGLQVVAQPHCHHHAVMGWSADAALLRTAGATVTRLGGCCGLAGNWGVERGHHEVSLAVAAQQLLPAVQDLDPAAVVLADGFSCRTQLDQLTDRRGIHLAELLDRAAR